MGFDPKPHLIKVKGSPLAQRLWAKTDKNGPEYGALGPCWAYSGNINAQGYGRVWNGTTMVRAHRAAYELLIGPIPLGREVDHICRNRCCVNPDHLELVTQAEHGARSGVRGGVPQGFRHQYCRRGHPLSAENRLKMNKGETCRICFNEGQRRRYAERRAAQDTV